MAFWIGREVIVAVQPLISSIDLVGRQYGCGATNSNGGIYWDKGQVRNYNTVATLAGGQVTRIGHRCCDVVLGGTVGEGIAATEAYLGRILDIGDGDYPEEGDDHTVTTLRCAEETGIRGRGDDIGLYRTIREGVAASETDLNGIAGTIGRSKADKGNDGTVTGIDRLEVAGLGGRGRDGLHTSIGEGVHRTRAYDYGICDRKGRIQENCCIDGTVTEVSSSEYTGLGHH